MTQSPFRVSDAATQKMPAIIGIAVAASTFTLSIHHDVLSMMFALLLFVPALLIAAIALSILAFIRWERRRSKTFIVSAVLIVAIPPLIYYFGSRYGDDVVFPFWYVAHPLVVQRYRTDDGIVALWERYGFAGDEFDSYVIAAHGRDTLSLDEATRWVWRHGFDCDVGDAERVASDLYIITTNNCPLERWAPGPSVETPGRSS